MPSDLLRDFCCDACNMLFTKHLRISATHLRLDVSTRPSFCGKFGISTQFIKVKVLFNLYPEGVSAKIIYCTRKHIYCLCWGMPIYTLFFEKKIEIKILEINLEISIAITARSPKVWSPLIHSHSFMKALTNQKSRAVPTWLLIGLNLHERMWIN